MALPKFFSGSFVLEEPIQMKGSMFINSSAFSEDEIRFMSNPFGDSGNNYCIKCIHIY